MGDGQGAEVAALRIILSNVVARLATAAGPNGSPEIRELLDQLRDECRLAAERVPRVAGADPSNAIIQSIDQFFKGITIR